MLHPDYLMGVKGGHVPPNLWFKYRWPPWLSSRSTRFPFLSSTNHSHLHFPPLSSPTHLFNDYCGYCSCSHLHLTLALQTPHTSPS